MALRLVLAEDSYLVREGVRSLLDLEDEIALVGVCEDFEGLLACVDSQQPDVVVTDIRMPPTGTDEGIRAANLFRDRHPQTGVVVLSHYLEPDYALALFNAGANGRGYLLKERVADIGQLSSAVRTVAGGGTVIDPSVVEALVTARMAPQSALSELTRRELETLSEMAQGKNNAAIAEALVLSDRAVEKYISAVFSKLGLTAEDHVHRRVKAVLVYLAEKGR